MLKPYNREAVRTRGYKAYCNHVAPSRVYDEVRGIKNFDEKRIEDYVEDWLIGWTNAMNDAHSGFST